jgi:hypothetical protein
MVGSIATCAGSFDCDIINLGLFPGTSSTGNFVGGIASTPEESDECAADGLAAWEVGTELSGTELSGTEIGGLTFTPGVYTHGSFINIALGNPKVSLDAEGDSEAVFIFVAGRTLTTCAESEIVLLNGAKQENVFWVLGTSLTMGADSLLVGNVLAGSAITIGTNGKIMGRAITQTAMTCETACTIETSGRDPTCSSILPGSSDVTIQAVLEGTVPTVNWAPYSYNMMAVEGFSDRIYFIDQKEGILYEYPTEGSRAGSVENVFYFDSIEGLTATSEYAYELIHSVAPGSTDEEIYVVLSSTTLPKGITADLTLPNPSIYQVYQAIDETFVDALTKWTTVYKIFYKFKVGLDGLKEPEPFFALETNQGPGHLGGGILTLNDGRILWAVGDGLPYGTNGLEPSQDLKEHFGKIILIDPMTDPTNVTSKVVATGIRNCQQMNLVGENVVFMDIGGVTAEEVNAVPLADLLDTRVIENFGWGIRNGEDFGREGTFKVAPGVPLAGGQPECLGEQDESESDFIKPWTQFGRGPDVPLYAISGSVVSEKSFSECKLFFSEFNTGLGICVFEDYDAESVAPASFVTLVDENFVVIDGFNTFVDRFFDGIPAGKSDKFRGDARPFKYPDGSAGVFIERTGQFFKLTEVLPNDF